MKLSGTLNLDGGQLMLARQENVASLPLFVAGRDEGRIIYVTTGGDQGYWFGASDGSAAFQRLALGTTLVDYTVADAFITAGNTLQNETPASTSAPAAVGFTARITLSSTLSSGQVTVNLYEDSGYTQRFYSNTFDLANPVADNLPSFFELQDVDGDMFVEIINDTGSDGLFTVTVRTAGTVLVQVPPPPGDGSGINAGVAGDGINFDAINVRLDVDLATDPGLELTGAAGSRELRVLPAPGGGLERVAAGLQNDSTVIRTTGDQSLAGIKTFADSIFGLTPAGTSGAPTTGTHAQGEFFLDDQLDLYQCIVAGTPGTWQFYGWKENIDGGALNGISYTGTASAGSSVDLEINTTGRRGVLRFLRIWGADPAFATGDIDVEFRVAAFPNENMESRQQLWEVTGRIRRTTLSAGVGSGVTTLPVVGVGGVVVGDLVRLRQDAGPLEEYARVSAVDAGVPDIDVFETTANALALDDHVMMVTELTEMPWRNNSGVPSESQKIFLRFYNDHPSQDVVFGYEATFDDIGGGLPV